MMTPAIWCQLCGGLALALIVINQLTAPLVQPALQRSSALGALLSVGLMLVGVLWTRLAPVAPARVNLQGEEGLLLRGDLADAVQAELSWGSRLLLTATPAAVVVVVWNGELLLRRGLCLSPDDQTPMNPGPICLQALERGRAIHLVDLKHYPGRDEFTALLPELPSVLIQPLGSQGLLLVGGWSARCFSRADLGWCEGWADRLTAALQEVSIPAGSSSGAAPALRAPVIPAN